MFIMMIILTQWCGVYKIQIIILSVCIFSNHYHPHHHHHHHLFLFSASSSSSFFSLIFTLTLTLQRKTVYNILFYFFQFAQEKPKGISHGPNIPWYNISEMSCPSPLWPPSHRSSCRPPTAWPTILPHIKPSQNKGIVQVIVHHWTAKTWMKSDNFSNIMSPSIKLKLATFFFQNKDQYPKIGIWYVKISLSS